MPIQVAQKVSYYQTMKKIVLGLNRIKVCQWD